MVERNIVGTLRLAVHMLEIIMVVKCQVQLDMSKTLLKWSIWKFARLHLLQPVDPLHLGGEVVAHEVQHLEGV